MITLDGSHCEGGGQIVRTALALSTILQKPFEITDIRKGRDKPGLKNQHLFCIKALEDLCNAKTEGAELGSTNLKYWPGKIKGHTISIDIGTAGSITLLLQSLLIPSILADSKVRLKITGGTDVSWSPQFDYLNNVILPHLKRYADIEAKLEKRGYYPKGQGKVDIKIKQKFTLDNIKKAPSIELTEQHNLIHIKGISHASLDLQKAQVAERQASSAKFTLNKLNCPVQIRTEYPDTLSTGSGITLWATFSKNPEDIDFNNPIIIGADILGERGKRSEEVGKEAADKLLKEIESKAPIDSNLADNLIPFLAIFGGKMRVSEITNHALTNIYACEQFLGKIFDVDKENLIIEAKLYK
ncbi:MAG: RNA 3'-terminal phosphate cyclase [Nanoarchaeota archaeon]|nr:RNA 3'-terminal phosphate cyclase [Nanoarchaeota archaeon]MBU1005757.1 RNA 3'-terminal phosphate cyclase [Nanoarchaeota archaeon]MBU1946628.1 RNA 3'-terminal phosphate cyclase [Nanoarchaeota archaeon]